MARIYINTRNNQKKEGDIRMNSYHEVTGRTTPQEAEALLFKQAKAARKAGKLNFFCFQKVLKDAGVDYLG